MLDVDEVLAQPSQRLVVDAEALRHAGAGVDHEDVEARREAAQRFARCLLTQVEDDAALAAVERVEELALVRREAGEPPRRIAARRLDLHHFRAEVGEVLGAVGPDDVRAHLEHAHALQGARFELGHARTPPSPPRYLIA